MTPRAELQQLPHNFFVWQAYDRQLKTDLCSSAVTTQQGIFLIDPIPLEDGALKELRQGGTVAGVIVTNANHLRASHHFSTDFGVPIFTRNESISPSFPPDVTVVEDGTTISPELTVISIEGAAPGEIALYFAEHGGTLVLGDALINFEPYGFTFLPRKYCSNQKQMRCSLRKLGRCRFDKLLFAHGAPILSEGDARLQRLLNEGV